jgi:hypothetical protein
MNEMERTLQRSLVARADTVVAGERLSGDAVVAAGRTARRRRRQGVTAAVVAGALVVVVGVGVLAQTRSVGTAPVPPGSGGPTSSSATTTPTNPTGEPPLSPPGAVPVASLGIDLAVPAANRVFPADGNPFTVPLPAGHAIDGLVRVPDGWLLTSYLDSQGPEAGFYLWFVPKAGEPTSLGRNYGNFEVSADGRRLVVASGEDHLTVTAYDLPSLRFIARVRIEGPGPLVSAIVGERVVLYDATGDGSPTRAYVWNLRTEQLRATDADVNLWGVTDDGRVLRRVARDQGPGCVDLVAAVDLPTVRDTGLCSEVMGRMGHSVDISPDGTWALMTIASETGSREPPVWVRTADLRAGRWRPTASGLTGFVSPLFWDTDQTVIVRGDESEYFRCRPTQPCQRLAVPAYPDGVILVRRRG